MTTNPRTIATGKGVAVNVAAPHPNGQRGSEITIEESYPDAHAARLDAENDLLLIEDERGNPIACYQWSMVTNTRALNAKRGVQTNGNAATTNLATGANPPRGH